MKVNKLPNYKGIYKCRKVETPYSWHLDFLMWKTFTALKTTFSSQFDANPHSHLTVSKYIPSLLFNEGIVIQFLAQARDFSFQSIRTSVSPLWSHGTLGFCMTSLRFTQKIMEAIQKNLKFWSTMKNYKYPLEDKKNDSNFSFNVSSSK